MTEGRAALEQLIASAPYRAWAALPGARTDAGKVAAEMRGERRPTPGSSYARGLVRLARLHPTTATLPPAPPVTRFELLGFVRDVSHVHAGDDRGKAFTKAGGSKVLIQFADPANDVTNRKALPAWQTQWKTVGVDVEGWWRVEHTADNRPTVPQIARWWPNAEQPPEVARLPVIYEQPGVVGLVTLGKIPGVPVPGGMPVAIECFRETPSSDTSITNSVRYWTKSGIPVGRLIVMLQGYGTPFGTPVEQAREALAVGARRVALYPFDGFSPADITAIAEVLR